MRWQPVVVGVVGAAASVGAHELPHCNDLNLDSWFDVVYSIPWLQPCMEDTNSTDYFTLESGVPLTATQWTAFFDSSSCRELYNNLSLSIYNNTAMPLCRLDKFGTTRRDLASLSFDQLRDYMASSILPLLLPNSALAT
ncbi:hypothetical protein ACHHYP_08884 [Achlya hypogyna]|uniref:Uncharacterized protein n=1 Tax=Achlya hypogyna TaxID=1202772 RepID=A0A1V9YNR6_ACHHY|nr:hypothetical protein ACHHYP_08884 [Achlya hypogyna]